MVTNRSAPTTEMVMDTIRRRVGERALMPGEKIPSIRTLAARLDVSPSTVVEAYDRLVSEGAIRSRPGSGFVVAGPAAPLTLTEVLPRLDRAVDPFWISRQSLDAGPQAARPGCGWLPADWMPAGLLRNGLRKLARGVDAEILTDYGSTRGGLPLRAVLARRLAREGLDLGADQILLTASGTQALDLLCRFLLRPGDAVLVDDPCYFNFQAVLRVHQARIVGVPFTPTGPDLAAFRTVLETHRPRIYLTNSALQNPTGGTLSPQAAHCILTLCAQHELSVIEDDIFADLEAEPSPRLAALDGLSRVLRIGSFSKTLSASVRCGYVAGRSDWIEALADLQVATNFGGPSPLAAELVATVLGDGSYQRHLSGLRTRLAKCRRAVAAGLVAAGIEPLLEPGGGFYLWCRLPERRDAVHVATAALREGVVLAPGNVFSLSRSAGDLMRFNVAQMTPAILPVLVRALAQAPRLEDHPGGDALRDPD